MRDADWYEGALSRRLRILMSLFELFKRPIVRQPGPDTVVYTLYPH